MPATDIAIVGFAQTKSERAATPSEVQLLVPTVTAAIAPMLRSLHTPKVWK